MLGRSDRLKSLKDPLTASGLTEILTDTGIHVQVLVRDNNVDQALRALKKKMQREGIFREMKMRGHYEKPSESALAKRQKPFVVHASWPVSALSVKVSSADVRALADRP